MCFLDVLVLLLAIHGGRDKVDDSGEGEREREREREARERSSYRFIEKEIISQNYKKQGAAKETLQ